MTKKHTEVGENHKLPFIDITFQVGAVHETGLNGCRVEDVIDVLAAKLEKYQDGPLACLENQQALDHLAFARKALLRRRKLRTDQGVIDTYQPHKSMFDERTEDKLEDFSATGS